MNDGGEWAFFLQGEQQVFENPERYKAHRIAEPFTPEMLEKYCAYLGIRLFDENFYAGKALVVKMPELGPQFPSMSLADARKYTLLR